jgi:hypothetical protein
LASLAGAQVPDPEFSLASAAITEPVSIYSLPDGTGWGLDEAMLMGGNRTDATIILTLLDGQGNPIFNYPAENSWLDLGGNGNPCQTGSIADGNTDALGQTTFSGPLLAGGSGAGATVMVGTWPEPEYPVLFPQGDLFRFNSPDINGDHVVNLADVALFSADFFGNYNYRSDFFWDGVISLSDVALMAQGMGSFCP